MKVRLRISNLILLMLLFLPALSAADTLYALEFRLADLTAGQKYPVYSAPSAKAWRGAKGKAAVSTNDSVWEAGWDGQWLLVMYETNNGAVRVGYVDGSALVGKTPSSSPLELLHQNVTLSADAALTDDPQTASSTIAKLGKGGEVELLASYGYWVYVQTTVDGKTVRGFLPGDCVDLTAISSGAPNGESEQEGALADRSAEDGTPDVAGQSLLDGVLVIQSAVSPLADVPEASKARGGSGGESQSELTNAGSDWYGLGYSSSDDMVSACLYATDSRGYYLYSVEVFDTTGLYDSWGWTNAFSVRAYELPNGDIYTEGYDYHISTLAEFGVYRRAEDGFVRLAGAAWDEEHDVLIVTDDRSGAVLTYHTEKLASEKKNAFLCEALELLLADWNLSFQVKETMHSLRTGADILCCRVSDEGLTAVDSFSNTWEIPEIAGLRREAQDNFIAEEADELGALPGLLQDLEEKGMILTQRSTEDKTDENGSVCAVWKTYGTPAGTSIRFSLTPDLDDITEILIDDSGLYESRVYKNAAAVGQESTTEDMRGLYQALMSSDHLGIAEASRAELARFDLQWTDEHTEPYEFAVDAAVEADGAAVYLKRSYWRVGAEYFTSRLTITLSVNSDANKNEAE